MLKVNSFFFRAPPPDSLGHGLRKKKKQQILHLANIIMAPWDFLVGTPTVGLTKMVI